MNNKNEMFIKLLPLETKRLIIRPTSTEDIDLILKMDKQVETQIYLGGTKNKSKEERLSFLEKKVNKFKAGYMSSLTICLKDGTSIGFCELNINEDNNTAELSYIFDFDYCNKGFCTEACSVLIKVGFEKIKLNKIHANTLDENESSKRVLEKLNFKPEGVRKKKVDKKENNQPLIFLNYELLNNEYMK